MLTQEISDWVVDQAPSPREVRMPRARSRRESEFDIEVIEPFHSHWPLKVVSCAATLDVSLSIPTNYPAQAALEAFSGAAFDTLGVTSEALQKVISNVALEKRLNSLSVDFYEDFGTLLDQASIAGLRHFLLAHQDVATPNAISADSSGRIEAIWDASHGQSASLKFIDDEKFHYALVVETPEGRKRPWGTASRFEVFVARPEARTILGESSQPPLSVT